MKILHVIPGFAQASGPTHVTASLAEGLSERGHEVEIVYTSGRGRDADVLVPKPPVKVNVFPCRLLREWAWSPELGCYLSQAVAQFDIMHLHSLWCYPGLAAAAAGRRAGTPWIVRPAGTLMPWALGVSAWRKKLYFQALEKRVLTEAAAVHTMSPVETRMVRAAVGEVRVIEIPNGMDPVEPEAGELDGVRRQLGIEPGEKLVLSLGRLHPVKNLELVIAAAARVQRRFPMTRLVIAGPVDTPYAEGLKALASTAGMLREPLFPGPVTGAAKRALFRLADVFVMASRSENFGNAVLEALAAGTPCVVAHGAPWEVLETAGAGRWVPCTEEAVSWSLEEILANKGLRATMSGRAVELVRSRFAWRVIAGQVEAAYAGILAERAVNQGEA